MKRLLFACLLFAGCTHSQESTSPAAATAVIPAASVTTPPGPAGSSTPVAATTPCDVPADFPVADALAKGADVTEVLAWRSRVDDRPLYVEDALVWQQRTDSGHKSWSIAHVYRHPKDENKFRLSIIFDSPQVAQAVYDHPPNGKDIEKYLGESTFSWSAEGFTMTAGHVCTGTWTRLVGEAPKHDFTK